MSATSVQRIYDKFSSQVVQACSEGRGEELIHAFMRDLAADVASTVFLKMEAEVSKPNSMAAEDMLAWLDWFSHSQGLKLVESVSETMTEFGGSVEQIRAAELSAAEAYQAELNRLIDTSRTGGRA